MAIAPLQIVGKGFSRNMKRACILLPILTWSISLFAQSFELDTAHNQQVLIGKVAREHLEDSIWFKENYQEAIIAPGSLEEVDKYGDGVSIEIYFGSWCDDSQYWVPAFFGLIEMTGFKDSIQLIALPRSKTGEETLKLKEPIDRVPSFVFWRNGKEIGRIIESPEVSLAKDMIVILKQ